DYYCCAYAGIYTWVF
nr:immunoglobulin light chain junction region [Macaca mulatta]